VAVGTDGAPEAGSPKRWLTRQVLGLGLVSLFTDVGMEMGLPLLPAVLSGLGGGAVALGLVDGLPDTLAALLQVFSGRWADRIGKRKPFVVVGHSLSALLRPLFGLAAAPWQVVAVRAADRVGKGLRKPSMSSLLEGASSPETRGRVFGFNDALDNAGQMLGPLLAVLLLTAFAMDAQRVLLWTLAPGLLTIAAVLILVKEPPSPPRASLPPLGWAPPREILPALIPIALFTLGNASDLFLVKKVLEVGAPLWTQVLLWAGFAAVKIFSALLGGRLADRLGPRLTISLSWAWYAVIYFLFAFVSDLKVLVFVFLAYGLFHGLSEGPQKALIGSLAPQEIKGTCYGWFGLVTGILSLPAGLLCGLLWWWQGAALAFSAGALLALAGLLFLWLPLGAGAPPRPATKSA
jgi:MFS family permease